MTLVVAKSFGDRITILSDTMISDNDGGPANAIPGQLKSLILSGSLSVAFAGNLTRGIDAVRAAKKLADAGEAIENVLEHFRQVSAIGGERAEFLIASHAPGATLHRVWEGRISDSLKCSSIGVRAMADHFFSAQDEADFSARFVEFFVRGGIEVGPGVGGIPVQLLCAPEGHCYVGHALSTTWGPIDLLTGATIEDIQKQESGMTAWTYHVCDSATRGASVLGLYVDQANAGYLYDPFNSDSAVLKRPTSLDELSRLVEQKAGATRGSFCLERDEWWRHAILNGSSPSRS